VGNLQLRYLARVIWACVAAGGCGPRLSPPPPPLDPPAIAAAAIAELDANRNGSLDARELTASPGLRAAADLVDADKNGALSQHELAARFQRYGEFPVANLTFTCVLTQDGQPLADAEVRLVPEKCFGASRRAAVGKTDANGLVNLKVEGHETYGVPNGIYRIEISKKDQAGLETIKSIYNAPSGLGKEIAFDRRELEGGLRIEL